MASKGAMERGVSHGIRSRLIRLRFMIYSRPVFRANDLLTTHLSRLIMRMRNLAASKIAGDLHVLDARKREIQLRLAQIGQSHGHVCAQCGRCCKGTHERDSFSDRIMLDPGTRFTNGRRRESDGETPALLLLKQVEPGGTVTGACYQLTGRGCRLPSELRPIQCSAYFCWAAVGALSDAECTDGTRAIKDVLKLQWRMVGASLKSRRKLAKV